MLKFVSFLHLQSRHEKHTKIVDNNYKYQSNHNHNNNTHRHIRKILHNTSDGNVHASKEQPPLGSYLRLDNDEHHAANSPADAAPTATAAWCCSQSVAGEFCRCSGDDRCATGAPCPAARCCCCSAQCASARLWRTPTFPGCRCAPATRRFSFCRLSSGICPIRQQLQWAHGAAFSREPTPDCADCRLPAGITDCQQDGSGRWIICYECCHTETLPSALPKSPNKLPSLTPFRTKLKLLAGTNCC